MVEGDGGHGRRALQRLCEAMHIVVARTARAHFRKRCRLSRPGNATSSVPPQHVWTRGRNRSREPPVESKTTGGFHGCSQTQRGCCSAAENRRHAGPVFAAGMARSFAAVAGQLRGGAVPGDHGSRRYILQPHQSGDRKPDSHGDHRSRCRTGRARQTGQGYEVEKNNYVLFTPEDFQIRKAGNHQDAGDRALRRCRTPSTVSYLDEPYVLVPPGRGPRRKPMA